MKANLWPGTFNETFYRAYETKNRMVQFRVEIPHRGGNTPQTYSFTSNNLSYYITCKANVLSTCQRQRLFIPEPYENVMPDKPKSF